MHAGTNDQLNGAFLRFNNDFNLVFGKSAATPRLERDNSQYLQTLLDLARQETNRQRGG
jgi:IS1 family transposase